MSLKPSVPFGHRQALPQPPRPSADRPAQRVEAPDDRRRAPRERCLLLARVVYGQPEHVTEAIVRNISDTGALLEISAAIVLPPTVTVLIERRRMMCNARVVWRRGGTAGIAWESEPVMLDPSDGGALVSIARQIGLHAAVGGPSLPTRKD